MSNHIQLYREHGWRTSLEAFLISDEYWHRIGDANARSFLSAAWRDIAGGGDPADVEALAAALDEGAISRHAAINALTTRSAVAEAESNRLWTRLTGLSDPAPDAIFGAFENSGREAAIIAICEHPAFVAHAEKSAGAVLIAPEGFAHGVYQLDVYRSYQDSDLALLAEFAATLVQPADGYFTDFLGRVTDSRILAEDAFLEGKVAAHIPVPSDGFHAETIEYLGLMMAFKTMARDAFVCVEFGAGWGPWTAAAGIIARRRGVARFSALAVEAGIEKIPFMKQHLIDNGLQPDSESCRCVHGAVWTDDGVVHFPAVSAHDHAAAAAEIAPERDYRGESVDHVPVPAYTIETLLGAHDIVDFIHMDIQGAEADVCEQSIAFLMDRVRYLFIATHSRTIEGRLITLFRSNGFEILREKPCRFRFDQWPGSLEGITTQDGGQLWRNPRLM